ncbi:MAG: hypothetical protein PHO32_08745, partial [Candidatus Cloacimonetes bacterium]|nr:hypothetical protein [Candidatus Cloacimonadota bacterium]
YPTQAIRVSPANGSTIADTGTSLSWMPGVVATPTGYRIFLGTDNPPTNMLNGLDLGNTSTCYPAGLMTNATYYWQVQAYNSLGDAPPATIWSFNIAVQTVNTEIGTGTSTNRSPFGTGYGYERDATLYLASEIGALPQSIQSLAWYATRSVSTATPVKLYLKATTATALPAVNWASTITGATLVFNGTINSITANSWMNINLSSAFTLPEANNLMVLIETNYGGTGSGNSLGGGFRNTNYSPINTRHKFWSNNNTPPTSTGSFDILRANIRITSGVVLPNPAVVTAPINVATNVAISSTLNWASGGGNVSGYRLYLGTDGNGNSTPSNLIYGLDLGNNLSYTPPSSFAFATTYFWKVVSYNSAGAATGSSIWSFTTELPPVPNEAVHPLPADLATDIGNDAQLSWSPNPAGTVPTGYNVYFGTTNPPALVGNQTATSYDPGTLAFSTTYYWQIDPQSARGFSSEANTLPVWSFTTALPPVPNVAVNPLPADLATDILINAYLNWSPNPEGTTPIGYNVYFGTGNPPDLIGNQTTTSYDPGTLEYGTTYYWQIDPQSARGFSSDTNILPVWSFTTEYSPYPTQAILVAPAIGSLINTGGSLTWFAGLGATPTGYRISLGTDNPPTNLLNAMDLGNVTTCNPAGLMPNTTYYWQVQAYNSLGDAPPATIWSFMVAAQSVSIGTGTSTNRSPFGTSFGFERDATLYLASEIGTVSQPIRSLAWYATRNVSTSTPVKVYLKATTATALPAVNWASTISGATLVFNGTISSITANAWMNINLSSAFTLPSGNNLMVLIETNLGGSGNGNFDGGGFRNTNYSPNNTLHKYWMSNYSAPTTTGSFDILRANIRISSSTTVVELPGSAVASSPLIGATNVPLTASLNWNSGGGTVSGYRLYMGTDGYGISTPTNLIYGLDLGNTLSYTPPSSFAYATTYYWQVIPFNISGTAIGGSIWSFTTESEPVPSLDVPTNLIIALQDGMVYISWDAVPNAESYQVFSSDDPDAEEWGTPRAITATASYSEAATLTKRFYRVSASSAAISRVIRANATEPPSPLIKPRR